MGVFSGDDRPPLERRKSFRCRVDESLHDGQLKVNEREIPVTILDESAGGFCVGFRDMAVPEIGSILLLKTPSGCAEVKVMNIAQEEAGPIEEGAAPSIRARLGLQRLRDLSPWEISPQGRWSLAWLEFKLIANPSRAVMRLLAGAAVMLIVSLVAAVVVLWNLEHSPQFASVFEGGSPASGKRPKSSRPAAISKTAHPTSRLAKEPFEIPVSMQDLLPDVAMPSGILDSVGPSLRNTVAGAGSDSQSASPESRAEPVDEVESRRIESLSAEALSLKTIPQEILRRSFPQTLLQPHIAEALALTQEQKEKLRQLYSEALWLADKAVESFTETQTEAASPTPSPAESDLAYRTLAILSPDQLRRWGRLVSELGRPDPVDPQDGPRPAVP